MYETGSYQVQEELKIFQSPLWITSFYWLFWRSMLTVFRDPTVQLLRILQKIAIGVMAGLCFMGAVNLTQAGVQAISGILFIMVAENAFTVWFLITA